MTAKSNSIRQAFKISSYDLDPCKKARLTTVANFFQEMAYQHAEMLGFGFNDLKKHDTFWVLARMKIRMDSYPAWDEEVVVETWHRGMDRLFGLRDFILSDAAGDRLGVGSTAWLILDGKSRRPVREFSDELLDTAGEGAVFEGGLEKVALPAELELLEHRRVRFSDLDIVGHVNNVKFMEWCVDVVRRDPEESRDPREFEINFIREALPGDSILIKGVLDKCSDCYFVAVREADSQEIFRARLSWMENDPG